eukprot:TRINITY_DN14689_c0_g1_i1.p1 TRINITY_DN14689_c0_g1~~TRINITY_DN14689_c0_g1_i1.p1  ORF type:complete len:438 (-),score=137.83 TRINITY_DN14689_c0_g1_i1:61-1374(-)
MAAAVEGSFASVAKRQDEEDKQLQDGDKLLAALEADLQASEEQLERAEARYAEARKRVAKELGADVHSDAFDPDADDASQAVSSTKKADDEDEKIKEAVTPKADRSQSHAGTKNAKVLPEKVLSCQRWLAKRSSDHRAREADRRNRDLQRRNDRDRKFESADVPDAGKDAKPAEEAPAPAAAATTRDAEKEAAALQQGAKSIAGRLKCLSERPDSSDKRASLMKVLTAGRPNFYSFNFCDALVDLQQRGELSQAMAEELLGVLASEDSAGEGEKLTPADWLEHAKKVSHLKRLDDAPFKDVECLYLGSLDGRVLAEAEAELEAAEAQLEAAVCLATEAYCGREVLEAEAKAPADTPASQVEIDEDRAADMIKAGKVKEHKGVKNTSALPEKVVSCQKWLAARASESRARDAQKKAKDLLRAKQRDGKGCADSGYGAA